MNAQAKAPADGVNQSGDITHAAIDATHLIAACALSTGASGTFGIWTAAKMPMVAQKGRYAF